MKSVIYQSYIVQWKKLLLDATFTYRHDSTKLLYCSISLVTGMTKMHYILRQSMSCVISAGPQNSRLSHKLNVTKEGLKIGLFVEHLECCGMNCHNFFLLPLALFVSFYKKNLESTWTKEKNIITKLIVAPIKKASIPAKLPRNRQELHKPWFKNQENWFRISYYF